MSTTINAPISITSMMITAPITLGGRSAYQSYLATSGDDPLLSEVEWAASRTTVTSTGILDASALGRSILTAETAGAALVELGAGATGAAIFAAGNESVALATLGKRVFHLGETQTVDTLAVAVFPGLSSITLKPNTHYRVSGWMRWECIAASFDFRIASAGGAASTFDFDATETNHRSWLFTNAGGNPEAQSHQTASVSRPFFSSSVAITRKSRSLFDGFFLTTAAATTVNVSIVNRSSTGTVAVRDGVIIFKELF